MYFYYNKTFLNIHCLHTHTQKIKEGINYSLSLTKVKVNKGFITTYVLEYTQLLIKESR